jgi:hypothetical protein
MEKTLPEDFDGVFRFTNVTNEDFVTRWDKVEYIFPAHKTSPMIMNFTPAEIQNIRKKFAKRLAEREFYKTKKFRDLNKHVPGAVPPSYTDSDLAPFIQQCLEPLPLANAKTKIIENIKLEEKNRKDEEGNLVTEILDKKKSLIKEGSTLIND